MKVLFLDNFIKRPGYEKIKLIPAEELPNFKRGARRLIVDRSTRMEIATNIYQSCRNTMIVVEDSRMIVPSNISDSPWEDLLISNKNISCALVFMYHGFSGIPPKMYQYIDQIEIFKTRNHPHCRKSDIMNYDECIRIYDRVTNHKNQFYHETLNNGS